MSHTSILSDLNDLLDNYEFVNDVGASRKSLNKSIIKIDKDYSQLSEGIASFLGLHINTVNRWWSNKYIPVYYYNDLIRFCSQGGEKIGNKEQFYTTPKLASHCFNIFNKISSNLGINLDEYTFLEPSAGSGAFFDLMPTDRRIGLDISPSAKASKDITKIDYFDWVPPDTKIVVIGNPPFGLRGHLALKFINKSVAFADLIGFILPQLFNSDGKGASQKRISPYLRLAHTEDLSGNSFLLPNGSLVNVRTIFQVWSRISHDKIRHTAKKTCRNYVSIYSLSNGGTSSSTRNVRMIDNCDIYLPSTCFRGMKAYSDFNDLPNKRGYGIVIHNRKSEIYNILLNCKWENIAFRSTNGAFNLRVSLIEEVVTSKGFFDRTLF